MGPLVGIPLGRLLANPDLLPDPPHGPPGDEEDDEGDEFCRPPETPSQPREGMT